MNQNINQDIAMAIFNSTDRPSQSRNIISLREQVEAYAKQRVIEELEEQMELAEIGNSYTRLRERVQELKQDQDEK